MHDFHSLMMCLKFGRMRCMVAERIESHMPHLQTSTHIQPLLLAGREGTGVETFNTGVQKLAGFTPASGVRIFFFNLRKSKFVNVRAANKTICSLSLGSVIHYLQQLGDGAKERQAGTKLQQSLTKCLGSSHIVTHFKLCHS